jgi:lipoprotein-anchoring transpeptidase ErfK/SrfK
MPYAMYFVGGFAMHEYPDVPGYPASHGCVRMPAPEAPVVWDFAGYGTPVIVA